jgi:hypothetical protein
MKCQFDYVGFAEGSRLSRHSSGLSKTSNRMTSVSCWNTPDSTTDIGRDYPLLCRVISKKSYLNSHKLKFDPDAGECLPNDSNMTSSQALKSYSTWMANLSKESETVDLTVVWRWTKKVLSLAILSRL